MQTITSSYSVSSGTMRPEDLIPTFIGALDEFDCKDADLHRIRHAQAVRGYYDTSDVYYDLETLFDLLNEYAGPNMYFGASEGDACDYGFWSCEDVEVDYIEDHDVDWDVEEYIELVLAA